MSVLVLCDHENGQLSPVTLNTITAATEISGNIDLLVAGDTSGNVVNEAASIANVNKVLAANDKIFENGLAENLTPLMESLSANYSHIMASATTNGKNVMPRLAAKLDVMQISDIIKVVDTNTFQRPIYAGNAIQTVQSIDKIKLISVRTSNYSAVPLTGSANIKKIECKSENTLTTFIENKIQTSDRPELTSAKIVVSGGRGVGSKENFEIIEGLADKLGAAVGASRAAVDSGFAPNDWQVGQTGKVVAPDLYVAVGISGAIQHLAGMKDSKVIVAINKDEEAPIFQVADFGLVDDLFKAVPEMEKKL